MLKLYSLIVELALRTRSIFYYNPSGLECNWRWLQLHNFTNHPQLVWNSALPFVHLNRLFNNELFVLACLDADLARNELTGLLSSLSHLSNSKVLIELVGNKSVELRSKESLVKDILLQFRQKNMLNVVIYFKSTSHPLYLYSYDAFPQFTLRQRDFTKSCGDQLYPRQIENVKGYILRVIHDFSEPNTIIYYDANGKELIRGSLWDFIANFASTIGARLKAIEPTWPHGRHLGDSYMLELTKNNSVDIGLFTAQVDERNSNRFYQYSFPILYASWCVMMPLERPIQIPAIFKHILCTGTMAFLIIALICYWLSSLGSLFRLQRWNRCWRLSPRLLALLFVCLCQAQLMFLLIMHPRQLPIDSFDALLASDLRILGVSSEFYLLDAAFRARYAAAFRLTSNVSEFFELRNSFNTSWAYSITSNKWTMMEAQQENFQRSVFRYSDLCLHESLPYSIILDEDSVYYQALMFYSMRVHEAGLLEKWVRNSFYDMVDAGRMHLTDYSVTIEPQPLRLPDFQIPCRYFGYGIIIALAAFVIELLRFYINVFLENL
ncbi:uncharacterized protein LOC132785234 [Drosophila nasuta]|uniref:uncharacterized protein LOC132785234 n=1 Tax=Drosophila nasuta TaxID=42062 RepID=UPI00295F0EA0|nr:uncharacterized protein LOC132785234 [Drosophila nasuta]